MQALYFPRLSLPASTWVNPNLLYFDWLGVIAPDGGHDGLFDHRTSELLDLGMVRPVIPSGGWDREDDGAFIAFLLGQSATRRRFGRIERVHAGKLMHTPIAEALIDAGFLARVDGGWLEGPDWVVGHVMAYLAAQIATHARNPLPLITDERAAARVMVGPQEARSMSRRLCSIARLLPVPAYADPSDIDIFRRDHRNELHSFRNFVDELITRDAPNDDGEAQFATRLRDAERLRDHLVNEMGSFNWREQGPSYAIGIAGAAAPLIEQAPWSLGVGVLGLLYGGIQGVAAFRRRGRAAESPLVYATRAVGRWQPTARQVLE